MALKEWPMPELDGEPIVGEALQTLAMTNYGHFTSMRVEDQHVRGLSHHLDRLVRDCRELFGTELDRERVRTFIRRAVSGNGGSFAVRVTIFDPDLQLGHPGAAAEPHVLVTTRPAAAWPLPPMRVQAASFVRELPLVKHVGLFGTMRHRRIAQLNGFDDAVFVDSGSFVSEGATWNIGFYDGEQVIWPDGDVLPGVTMRLLKQVHDKETTAPVRLSDVPIMRAAFATNTSVGVRPISSIDDMELPAEHEIFTTLRKEYEEIPPERI